MQISESPSELGSRTDKTMMSRQPIYPRFPPGAESPLQLSGCVGVSLSSLTRRIPFKLLPVSPLHWISRTESSTGFLGYRSVTVESDCLSGGGEVFRWGSWFRSGNSIVRWNDEANERNDLCLEECLCMNKTDCRTTWLKNRLGSSKLERRPMNDKEWGSLWRGASLKQLESWIGAPQSFLLLKAPRVGRKVGHFGERSKQATFPSKRAKICSNDRYIIRCFAQTMRAVLLWGPLGFENALKHAIELICHCVDPSINGSPYGLTLFVYLVLNE